MKRLLLTLILLASTTCATRPITRIAHRQIGTATVEYSDGTILRYDNQYRTRVEGTYVILENVEGSVWGIRFIEIVGWRWEPRTSKPEVQKITDN